MALNLSPKTFEAWMADPTSSLETLPDIQSMLVSIKPKYAGRVPHTRGLIQAVAIFTIFMSQLAQIIRQNGYLPEKMGLVANGATVYGVLEEVGDPSRDLDAYVATKKEHPLNIANMPLEQWLRDYVKPARAATATLIGERNMLPIQVERATIEDSVEV